MSHTLRPPHLEETRAEAPEASESAPATTPPITPPTSNRIDRLPASCDTHTVKQGGGKGEHAQHTPQLRDNVQPTPNASR